MQALRDATARSALRLRLGPARLLEDVRVQADRLQDLREAVRDGWVPHPFREIMIESQPRFYTVHPEFQCAQAWSMIYFFLHGGAGGTACCRLTFTGSRPGTPRRPPSTRLSVGRTSGTWKRRGGIS